MDRLTKRMGGISYSLCDNVIIAKCENCNHRMPSCYDEDCQAELDVTTRLAAYEDTGLTPEEITALCDEVEQNEKLLESYKKSNLEQAEENYRLENENVVLKRALEMSTHETSAALDGLSSHGNIKITKMVTDEEQMRHYIQRVREEMK